MSTQHDDVDEYLKALLATAREVLGDNLIGAYAAGSIALNAYQPGRSDVDVALVSSASLTQQAKQDLVAALRHEALPCPARGLELVVYRREVAGSGTPEPGFEVELNTGATMEFRATYAGDDRAEADGRFWYGIDRSILRAHGRTLLGAPAGEVFGEIAPLDIRQLLMAALRWYLALPAPADNSPAPGAEDAVLGACRALIRIRTGRWLAKVPAGEALLELGWLASRPDAEPIRQSIAARTGAGMPPGGMDARRFQQRVLAEIAGFRS